MNFSRALTIAALVSSTFSAIAATDGLASASSSVGTFVNQIGNAAPIGIRVFGLRDSIMTRTSTAVPTKWGNMPGVANGFCVANSAGTAVTIRFTSPGMSAGRGEIALARSTMSGATAGYHNLVHLTGSAVSTQMVLSPTANTMRISNPQTNVTTCTAPNVTKTMIMSGGAQSPTIDTFVDTVTVTATLN